MKKTKEFFLQHKILSILIIIVTISFIMGIFSVAVLSNELDAILKSKIINSAQKIKEYKFSFPSLLSNISSNCLINLFIWLCGISLIGVPITITIIAFKSYCLAFSFTSFIIALKTKGLLFSIITILPDILALSILFFIAYYSLSFSMLLFNNLFRKKDYNKRTVMKRYLKLLLISSIILIIISIIDSILIPNLLNFLYF